MDNDLVRLCTVCGLPSRYQRTLCKYCNTRVRRARLKLAAVNLCGGKCTRCGYDELPWVMEFHHTDPSKKEFGISDVSKSWNDIQEELKKCEMLCANCHRAEHTKQQNDLLLLEEVYNYCGPMNLGDKFRPQNINIIQNKKNKIPQQLHCMDCNKKIKNAIRCKDCAFLSRRKFEVSKEELAKLVWEKPTTQIAQLFKVSDNAVAKRCKQLGVIKPPRGYWAKFYANK